MLECTEPCLMHTKKHRLLLKEEIGVFEVEKMGLEPTTS